MTICYTNTTIYRSICNLSFCSRHLLGLFGPQHALCIQGAMFSSAHFDVCRNIFARRWVSCHVVIPNFPDATRGDQNASCILVYRPPIVQSSFVPVIGGSSFSFASNRYRKSKEAILDEIHFCRYASACSCHCFSLNHPWGLKEKNG